MQVILCSFNRFQSTRLLNIFALLGILLVCLPAHAILNSPPDFGYNDGQAVFVDFRSAKYEVVIDFKNKKSLVTSTVTFYQDKDGYPIFDLVNNVHLAKLDGVIIEAPEIDTPDKVTRLRVGNQKTGKGLHTLEIVSRFDAYIGDQSQKGEFSFDYDKGYVDTVVYLSDLVDREFLEIVVATNFEFDAYKMEWDIKIESEVEHNILANGLVKSLAKNHFLVSYPDYFTTSSPLLRLYKKGMYNLVNFDIVSVTGRKIPVTVFSEDQSVVLKAKAEIIALMSEYEKTFVPWPHPALLALVFEGESGMEFVGGFIAGSQSVRHEFIHNYFARGIFPTDGLSSWMDESITRWIELGFPRSQSPICEPVENCSLKLDQLPRYIRHTTVIYSSGAAFIGKLDKILADRGGLRAFFPQFLNKYMFRGVTTEIFKNELEIFFGQDLTPEFNQHVYGR